MLQAGTCLGPYEIQSLLGAGGMGEVYLARDTRLGRTVALKILTSTDAPLKARFAREAKAISSLTHPNICALYDVGQHDGTDYLVMEYLEGETLEERLRKGPLKFEELLARGIEIADALDKSHRAGLVHRDLKPSNIMLTRGGAKLLDFGVAKLRADPSHAQAAEAATESGSILITRAGVVVGTPQYMAPEVLEGNEADARSDLFALGAVLFQMATGKRAFPGASHAALVGGILSTEPSFEEIRSRTSPGFAHLVKTCLAQGSERAATERARRQAAARMAGDSAVREQRTGCPRRLAALGMERARPRRCCARRIDGGFSVRRESSATRGPARVTSGARPIDKHWRPGVIA